MNKTPEIRLTGLDLIRSCAILFVIAGHFSLNTGFQQAIFEGPSMFIQGTMKFFFGMGVPLFLLLTGYLNSKKELSSRYYRGGLRVAASYLLFSIITVLFRKYALGTEYSWLEWGHKILSFSAIPYGWYIEMWIGLFLLTPFLNILYRHIPNQKQKLVLLGTLFLITALPDWTNRYGLHLVPEFWVNCFPLFFYFAGAYIREYQPSISKIWGGGGAIFGFCLLDPLFNTFFVKNHSMIQIAGDPSGIFGSVISILFFLIYYTWNTNCLPAKKMLAGISKASLDMYLCCYIFDALLYPTFRDLWKWNGPAQAGWYFPVIVPTLFLCSFTTAWLKEKILKF